MNEFFAAYRTRVTILLGFPVGVLGMQCLPSLPPWPVIIVLMMGAFICAARRLLFIACVCAGACWGLGFALFRMADAMPPELEGRDLVIEGVVASMPDGGVGETRFQFDLSRVCEPAGAKVPRHIRLSWYRSSTVPKAGEHWRFAVRLKRPRGMMNPGGMDYELWLFAQGIRATGYVRESAANERLGRDSPLLHFESWRQSLHDRLAQVLGGREFGGILDALAMGAEGGITTEQWDVLRRTGTAHLVAISGSHIALIAGWCFIAARWAACRFTPFRVWPPGIAAACSFLAALLYSALAGFAIPTQRALVMIGLVTGGILARRHLQPLHTLGLAFVAVLIVDPLAVLAPGFWLSYVAVALIWFTLAHRLRPPRTAATLWRINWATALGLAPLLLLFFGQVPLVSPLANVLAVPLIGGIVIPLVLLGSLLMLLSESLASWMFDLAERVLAGTWCALEWLASPAALVWTQAQPPGWTIPLALIGMSLLLMPKGLPGRWLGLMLLLPALTATADRLPRGAFELSVLDVGQGSSAVVRTRHRVLVFDTGARFSERFDIGAAVLVPFLRHVGIRRVDTLVVSHGDNDHSGGAASLMRLMPVGLIYASVPAELPSRRAIPCRAGQDWDWDGVHFMMLSPAAQSGNDNDLSCVLAVYNDHNRILLTGDIEKLAETELVARYGNALASEVLVVPHHGSKTSSTRGFLQKVRPRYALISAAPHNRFGFPHPGVLGRLNDAGATVLNTAREGAISVTLGAKGEVGTPRSYRRESPRYWRTDPE